MNPVFTTVFGRPLYWYGVFSALGFAAAVAHWTLWARRRGRPAGYGSDLAVWMMVGGVLGARAVYVAVNWREYLSAPWEIVRIDQGGLIFYGGLLGGVAACVAFARRRGESPWQAGDFAITGLPLAHAFGRVGCFLNGCCYGRPAPGALAVFMEGARRHPVQLYEAGLNLAVFAALLLYARREPRPPRVLALYLALYPAGRFLLEFLRGDPRLAGLGGLNVSQLFSLGFLAVAGLLWVFGGAEGACRKGS